MAYVYRHIRLDKNEPFYIGVGKDDDGRYKRAYATWKNRGRNVIWEAIVNKTEYEVEILIDNITWEEALLKEKEFISIYKRKIDGGVLANITLGGNGQSGMYGALNGMYGKKASEETKLKQRLKKIGKPPPNKGKPMLPHVMEKLRQSNTGRPTWNKGLHWSDESKKKMSETTKGMYAGEKHPFFGKKHSEESKEKMSKSLLGKPSWNKGKTTDTTHLKSFQFKKGVTSWNKGKATSSEHLKKYSFKKGNIPWNKKSGETSQPLSI